MPSSTSLTAGPDVVNLARTYSIVRASPGNVSDGKTFSYQSTQLTNGTAAGQADLVYTVGQQTIAAGGTLSINLASLTDEYGNSINFARIKRYYFANTNTTSATSITVGAAGIADPTVAPTLAQSASGGSVANGTYLVAYSWVNSAGETKVSPTASITVTGGSSSSITVTPPSLPSGVTSYNVYMSLVSTAKALAQDATGQSGSTYLITALPTTTNATQPNSNTTYSAAALFNIPGAGVPIRNGMALYNGLCPDATGFALTSGSKTLLITNNDQTNPATINLELIGASA